MGKWFVVLSTFYQKTETEDGTLSHGTKVMLKEVSIAPMGGYRVFQQSLGG
jgi:hypothetical protein